MSEWLNAAIAGLTAAGTLLAVVAVFGWRARDWLAREFSKTRDTFYQKMEERDETNLKRHEENLRQFSKIYIALARLGWHGRNGE